MAVGSCRLADRRITLVDSPHNHRLHKQLGLPEDLPHTFLPHRFDS